MTHAQGAWHGPDGARAGTIDAAPASRVAVRVDELRVDAVGPVSFELRRGEVAVVVSRPPCDGHTLLGAVAGLRPPQSGRVEIAGHDLATLGGVDAGRRRFEHIGYVVRDIGLDPDLTVAQNIAAPIGLAGRRADAGDAQWLARLAQSFGVADVLDLKPDRLDAGRQQCVAIARSLATRPSLVYAEEPTGRLDDRAGRVVLALLRTISHEYGIAIAISTERTDIAVQSDRVIVVRDGAIVADRYGADESWTAARLDDVAASA